MVTHHEFILPPFPRGYHIITALLVEQLGDLPKSGLLNVFIKHTSAGLTISENADPDVREDFELLMDRIVPENLPNLKHTMEGPDDMPSHVKSSLVGSHVTIPIANGRLMLGTWQGVYLCEFRNSGGARQIIATVYS